MKVLAMDSIMKVPFKVSTTTSNFMIGVTGAASAVVYLQRGYIDPAISMPVVIGVLAGVGYTVMGLKFAFALAVFAGLAELIPIIGPFLGGAPAVLIEWRGRAIVTIAST